jgi:hypothetical protein
MGMVLLRFAVTAGTAKVYIRRGHECIERKKYNSTLSLTPALDGVGGQSHAPAALPPEKRHVIHCIGGKGGPRAGLDGCGKYRRYRDSIPRPSIPWRVCIPSSHPSERFSLDVLCIPPLNYDNTALWLWYQGPSISTCGPRDVISAGRGRSTRDWNRTEQPDVCLRSRRGNEVSHLYTADM